ncbi:MAG: alpha/beta hydrolase-fold protein [Phycisphaerales bacterium]
MKTLTHLGSPARHVFGRTSRRFVGILPGMLVGLGLASSAVAQWVTPAVNVPRVQQRLFQSVSAGTTVSYHVYTPPAYDQQPQRRFPVLYWLHGLGSVLTGIGPLTSWFSQAMAQGKIEPMLIVFPNGMPYGMWCNSKDGATPMEDVVIGELLPEVDRVFRTIPARNGRVLEGFSMGGYGAARFGFKFPSMFAGVSMLGAGPLQLDFMDEPPGSPIPLELREQIFATVYGNDPAYFLSQSPWVWAESNAGSIVAGGALLRQLIGQADFTLPANVALHDHLTTLGITHDYWSPAGVGHDVFGLFNSLGESNWGFYRGAFAQLPGTCAADVGEPPDGAVDTRDLVVVLGSFGRLVVPGTNGDINFDGIINTLDLTALLGAFGSVCAGG